MCLSPPTRLSLPHLPFTYREPLDGGNQGYGADSLMDGAFLNSQRAWIEHSLVSPKRKKMTTCWRLGARSLARDLAKVDLAFFRWLFSFHGSFVCEWLSWGTPAAAAWRGLDLWVGHPRAPSPRRQPRGFFFFWKIKPWVILTLAMPDI